MKVPMMNDNSNILYDLAQALAVQDRRGTAIALRTLARNGYTNLEEVEQAADFELLAIGGIGPGRLAAVRRLTRPGWQPPSRQAVRTATRLFSAAQLALRFWRVEDLEAVLTGPVQLPTMEDQPVEAQLSLEALTCVAGEASAHHEPDALLRLVRRAALSARRGILG
jgi:hypothetical protein